MDLVLITSSRAHVKKAETDGSARSPGLMANPLGTSPRSSASWKRAEDLITREAASERIGSTKATLAYGLDPLSNRYIRPYGWIFLYALYPPVRFSSQEMQYTPHGMRLIPKSNCEFLMLCERKTGSEVYAERQAFAYTVVTKSYMAPHLTDET